MTLPITATHTVRIWDSGSQDYRSVIVTVQVDTEQLAGIYARKAAGNKSRKVKQCHGAVMVTA